MRNETKEFDGQIKKVENFPTKDKANDICYVENEEDRIKKLSDIQASKKWTEDKIKKRFEPLKSLSSEERINLYKSNESMRELVSGLTQVVGGCNKSRDAWSI